MDEQEEPARDLIRGVENGDALAEQQLWDAFFEKLLRHVENTVRNRRVPLGMIDEEAVAVSALESIFKCARHGRLQNIRDLTELSRLLFAMTNRKFVDHWRRASAQKTFPGSPPKELTRDAEIMAASMIPEMALGFEEELERLLSLLPDETHRQVAVLKLAGYTLEEMSEKIDRAVPTVTRKWRCVCRIWADELKRPV